MKKLNFAVWQTLTLCSSCWYTHKQTNKQTTKQKFGCEAEMQKIRKPEVKLHRLHDNY